MLLRNICSKLSSHAYYFKNDLDPIQNNDALTQLAYGNNCENGWINRQFIIPFIWILCTVTIALFGADGHGSWDRIEFKWERVISALVSFFYLILSPRLERLCCMQFIWNGSDQKPILIKAGHH
ncbi:hypothetical protein BLOT_014523 [Blomia tropicalis]|nr:hypothetical protein BLOT_014523 [Blomia tropicalis]